MTSYKVHYHSLITKDIGGIPNNMRGRIRLAIEERLQIDPINYGLPLRKSLHGFYKMRVGDYRVIYQVVKDDIDILIIGHRKDVYPKLLKRL